jgi:hypothetical protein
MSCIARSIYLFGDYLPNRGVREVFRFRAGEKGPWHWNKKRDLNGIDIAAWGVAIL